MSHLDVEAAEAELTRLANLLQGQMRPGWAFSLFLYQDRDDPQNGHVLHITRSRDHSLAAVSKWVHEILDARELAAGKERA